MKLRYSLLQLSLGSSWTGTGIYLDSITTVDVDSPFLSVKVNVWGEFKVDDKNSFASPTHSAAISSLSSSWL